MNIAEVVRETAVRAKRGSYEMARADTSKKNQALEAMAAGLIREADELKTINQKDLMLGERDGLSRAMLDRLSLTDARIQTMADGLREIAAMPDPVGEITDVVRRPSGIWVGRMRIALGVVAIIYESRPNVTADAAGLCLKAGNAVLLRGGSEALHSNLFIARVLQEALVEVGLSPDAVSMLETTEREAISHMLQLDDQVDLVIPRGGEGLIRFVADNSRIPVIKHFKGTCHVFVDEAADLSMATEITVNSKVQRPGVCNAAETLLVHQAVAEDFLPRVAEALTERGVELRGCPHSCEILSGITAAAEEDWPAEYVDLILAIRVVPDMDAAMDHIREHGSDHTETIVTQNHAAAMRFVREVDSSSVIINASTRFADGGEYGLGAEIGISTSKLHAFGPMGLRELTAQKFLVFGQGELRT